jgi:hypothetical protein
MIHCRREHILSAVDVYVEYLKRIGHIMFDADDGSQMIDQFDSAHEPVDNVGIEEGGVMILKARVLYKVFDLGRAGRIHYEHFIASLKTRLR